MLLKTLEKREFLFEIATVDVHRGAIEFVAAATESVCFVPEGHELACVAVRRCQLAVPTVQRRRSRRASGSAPSSPYVASMNT